MSSFGIRTSGGNPAGVVLDADALSSNQKKQIAKEIGFSETAFVEKSHTADFKVTFFTPTEEVDLCGHATIATYSLLLQNRHIQPGKYTQELQAGILQVEVEKDNTIIMDQSLPVYLNTFSSSEITDVLGVAEEDITSTNLLPQVVSTGLNDIFVPVTNRKILFAIKPDLEKMSLFNKKTNTIGFHVFTLDTVDPTAVAHSRNFAPLYGITEESATGSSTGALVCYLYKYGILTEANIKKLIFEQGYSMNNPCHIIASLEVKGTDITRVQVGGKAVLRGTRTITL